MKRCLLMSLIIFGDCVIEIHAESISLRSLRDVIKKDPEYIEPDNHNEMSPSFESFFRRQQPTGFDFLWNKIFSIKSDRASELLDVPAVKKLVDQFITKSAHHGDFVARLSHNPGDKLIVFGDIQGGFASLVRCLDELEKQGILSDDLKLKQGYKIIFNANLLGRTPYNIPLLGLVISLIFKNPDQIVYVRGRHEESDYWAKLPLNERLALWNEDGDKNPYSLASLLSNFFKSLPLAVYIAYNKGADLIRISGFGRDAANINERRFGDFFEKHQADQISYFQLSEAKPTDHQVHLRVLISSFRSFDSFVKNDGLVLIDYLGGAIVWSIFSSPTRLYQQYADFYYDAFALIELQKNLLATTITLYNRDVRVVGDLFKAHQKYILTSGQELHANKKPKKDEKLLVVGADWDLSKGSAGVGNGLKSGSFAYLDNYNRQGDEHGMGIKLIVRDHGYDPVQAVKDVMYFYEAEKTRFILNPNGSPTLAAILDVVQTYSMLTMFPATGISKIRSLDASWLVHFRASYRDEIFALLPFMIENRFVKRFAFFYQNDAFGQDIMAVVRELLPLYGITSWTELPYTRNITDFKILVDKVKEAQPEALGLFSASAATKEFLYQLGAHIVMNMKLFGVDYLGDNVFDQFIKRLGINCVICRVVPDPSTSDLPIVQEYRDVMKAAGLPYSYFSLEGYLGAHLLTYGIQHLQGDITPESLKAFFEQLKDVPFKGLRLNFDPKTRSLNKEVWLDTGDGSMLKITDPEKLFKLRHAVHKS